MIGEQIEFKVVQCWFGGEGKRDFLDNRAGYRTSVLGEILHCMTLLNTCAIWQESIPDRPTQISDQYEIGNRRTLSTKSREFIHFNLGRRELGQPGSFHHFEGTTS